MAYRDDQSDTSGNELSNLIEVIARDEKISFGSEKRASYAKMDHLSGGPQHIPAIDKGFDNLGIPENADLNLARRNIGDRLPQTGSTPRFTHFDQRPVSLVDDSILGDPHQMQRFKNQQDESKFFHGGAAT